MNQPENNLKWQNNNLKSIIIASIFLTCVLYLIWKAKYGYIVNDEPYIISCSQRLYLGDHMLVDDWFPAQLIGFINYPFYWLYLQMTGGLEGIVMFFRYCNVFLWSAAVILSYLLLHKKYHSDLYMCLGSISLLLFASLDQMTLSYNFWTICSLLLFITLQIHHEKLIEDFLSGILLSIACLACPYLTIPCLIMLGLYIVIKSFRNKRIKTNPIIKLIDTRYRLILLGVLPILVVFLAVVFTNSSPQSIAAAVAQILNAPTYSTHSFDDLIIKQAIVYVPFELYCGMPLLLISAIDHSNKKRNKVYLYLQMAISFVSALYIVVRLFQNHIVFNIIVIPMAVYGIQMMLYKKEKKAEYLFVVFVAACYSVSVYYGSNLGLLSQCMPLCFICWITFPEIDDYMQNTNLKTMEKRVLISIMILQIFTQYGIRTYRTYWDGSMFNTTEMITVGSAKGVMTTGNKKETYEKNLNEVKEILADSDPQSRVLFLPLYPYLYLDMNHPFGTHTTFSSNGLEYEVPTLLKYYSLHLSYYPQYIFVSKDIEVGNQLIDELLNEKNYDTQETSNFIVYIIQP